MYASAPSESLSSRHSARFLSAALMAGLLAVPSAQADHHKDGQATGDLPHKKAAVQEHVEVAYIGLVAGPLTPSLAAHLDLPNGVGLLVEYVDPKGAVADSIKPHDVLHKLNDQLLVNQQQFSTLVRSMDVGSEVELHILRKGKAETVALTLSKRQVPKWVAEGWRGMQDQLRGMQNQVTESYEQLMPRMRERLKEMPAKPLSEEHQKSMDDLVQDMKARMEKMKLEPGTLDKLVEQVTTAISNTYGHVEIQIDGANPGAEVSTSFHSGNTTMMTLMDGQHRITIKGKDGNKNLKAFDASGNLIFEGPINTDNERAEVPEDFRELLNRLEAAHQQFKKPEQAQDKPAAEKPSEKEAEQPVY